MSEQQDKSRLCKDCEFVVTNWLQLLFTGYEFEMCGAVTNLIDGTPDTYCQVMRRFNHLCGEEGKLFKQKDVK